MRAGTHPQPPAPLRPTPAPPRRPPSPWQHPPPRRHPQTPSRGAHVGVGLQRQPAMRLHGGGQHDADSARRRVASALTRGRATEPRESGGEPRGKGALPHPHAQLARHAEQRSETPRNPLNAFPRGYSRTRTGVRFLSTRPSAPPGNGFSQRNTGWCLSRPAPPRAPSCWSLRSERQPRGGALTALRPTAASRSTAASRPLRPESAWSPAAAAAVGTG